MEKLTNIQVLRACAAVMIVVHHCGIETARLAEAFGGSKLFNETPWGVGVPLFFAISGFIMVVTAGHAFGSPANALNFVRRRLIRIVPLYWAATTAMFLVLLVAPQLVKSAADDYLYVLSSYLFWPYMRITGDVRPLATIGWTLNLEMFFYIVFAFALMFPRRIGLGVLFGVLGLLVAARMAGLLPGVALNFWGDPIVLGFLSGAAVGIGYHRGWRLRPGAAAALVAAGFAILFQPLWTPQGNEDDFVPRLAGIVPSLLILLGAAYGPQIGADRPLWRPALLIGDASYSLYVVHEFMLRPLYLVWLKAPLTEVPLWTFIPVGVGLSLAASLATYRWFERPVTDWLNARATRGSMAELGRRLSRPRTAEPAAATMELPLLRSPR